MDVFAPELSQFWLHGNTGRPVEAKPLGDDDANAQRVAMQELVERVNAARSVV